MFFLGKISIVAWEAKFEQSIFSQFMERIVIWIFPLVLLNGLPVNTVHSSYSKWLLGIGIIFFLDIGNVWRNLILSKLSQNEIELTFRWPWIPVNPRSKSSVAITLLIIYGLFSYFGWQMISG